MAGFWDKFKVWKKPESTVEQSDRFSTLGYIQYPMRQQLDYRLFQLTETLREIQTEHVEPETQDLKDMRKLSSSFQTMSAPWCEGLDNRPLAKKTIAYLELKTIIGKNLTVAIPHLQLCTEAMIDLSWQEKHVKPETPVLFETKQMTQILPNQRPLKLGDLEQIGNTDREDSEQSS